VRVLASGETPPPAATAVLDQATLMIPLKGLIDVPAEIARLSKQMNKLREERTRTEAKLGNAAFVNGAPAEVVEDSRTRVKELDGALDKLQEQLARLRTLE